MKKRLLGFLLIFSLFLGCTSQYQYQMEQSLLLQENRRLENALYVTHTQLVDLKRENDVLRGSKQSKSERKLPEQPLLRSKQKSSSPVEDYEEAPPFAPPEIIIPTEIPGSKTVPDSLKSSKLTLPEVLPTTVLDTDEKSPPVWSAAR
ncbi:MAG: hypothetical protein LBI18_13205 [Planctomycetaceae bacterium]|jgi:hypothetical protein|nr:hypothetical protein [Planctomycetaceae bacterium]